MKYVFLFWIRGAESIITVGGESLGEVVFFFLNNFESRRLLKSLSEEKNLSTVVTVKTLQ